MKRVEIIPGKRTVLDWLLPNPEIYRVGYWINTIMDPKGDIAVVRLDNGVIRKVPVKCIKEI